MGLRTPSVVCLKASRVKYCIKTAVLPVVLYGYETWSISHREVYRFRLFENICSMEKVTDDGRKLHNEDLRNLYSLSDIIRYSNQ
jgi:hypothetical protein